MSKALERIRVVAAGAGNSAPVHIWIAGGGTGGHLYPGLAIAGEIVRQAPQVVPHFIGAKRGIERDVLPGSGYDFSLLDLHPLYRRQPWENWRTALGALRAWRTLSSTAHSVPPKAVIGTGGYAAAVALAWGRAHGVPLMLHEADSHPGLTTRSFSRSARAIYLGFPEAVSRMKVGTQTSVLTLGCPIEPPPTDKETAQEARIRWGFPEDSFVILIMGGSQGARAVNEAVAAWLERGLPPGVCLIWSAGKTQYADYSGYASAHVRVEPFISPIRSAYAAADLAVTRAGAMSIAELAAWGIPSILIPLPTAARDHQSYNARVTAQSGGALFLPQFELSAERLNNEVLNLMSNRDALAAMCHAMLGRSHPYAARQIAASILEILDILPTQA